MDSVRLPTALTERGSPDDLQIPAMQGCDVIRGGSDGWQVAYHRFNNKRVKRVLPWALALGLARWCWAQDRPDPGKGNEVFDEQCAQCHSADSEERKAGPSLQFLFAKEKLESNGKPVNEANVRETIDKGGKGMPAFKDTLAADDKTNLIAYLKTL
jgi:mono/diheme cytochrome c family protein